MRPRSSTRPSTPRPVVSYHPPPSPVRRLKLAEQPAASSQWRVLPDRSALLRLAVWGWAALAVWAALSLLLYHEPAIQGLLLR